MTMQCLIMAMWTNSKLNKYIRIKIFEAILGEFFQRNFNWIIFVYMVTLTELMLIIDGSDGNFSNNIDRVLLIAPSLLLGIKWIMKCYMQISKLPTQRK